MAFQSFEDLKVWQRGFLNIAKGSCGELRTQLYISRKLDFLNKSDLDRLISEAAQFRRCCMDFPGCSQAANQSENGPPPI